MLPRQERPAGTHFRHVAATMLLDLAFIRAELVGIAEQVGEGDDLEDNRLATLAMAYLLPDIEGLDSSSEHGARDRRQASAWLRERASAAPRVAAREAVPPRRQLHARTVGFPRRTTILGREILTIRRAGMRRRVVWRGILLLVVLAAIAGAIAGYNVWKAKSERVGRYHEAWVMCTTEVRKALVAPASAIFPEYPGPDAAVVERDSKPLSYTVRSWVESANRLGGRGASDFVCVAFPREGRSVVTHIEPRG
jgi:hypothetical protein